MNIHIFAGPSLSPVDGRTELDAIFQPPVSEGDVYRVVRGNPVAIGIIDRYFERVPSVWHKEILYALSRGIHVFGASSMGALRAAELAPFGMEGVGAIFEAYRDGRLEDDDEVAVVHGPADIGFLPMSEAMVNIRRALSDARTAGVIGADTREYLETIAKEISYRDRNYANILSRSRERGVPEADLIAFQTWLPEGRVDQKREDALLMLRVMHERFQAGCERKSVHFHFEHTTLWEQAIQLAGKLDRVSQPSG